jgi:sulfur-oxidizing protein SoxX
MTTLGAHAGASEQTGEQVAGKAIAFDESKGNCLACHAIEDGKMPGNIGPPLRNIRDRFPTREMLRAHIYDSSARVPDTIMPPYGRHKILTDDELRQVVSYIFTL